MDNVYVYLFLKQLEEKYNVKFVCNMSLYNSKKFNKKLVKGLLFPLVGQMDGLDSVNTALGCRRFCLENVEYQSSLNI